MLHGQLSADRDDKPLIYPESCIAFKMCTVDMDAGQIIIDMTTPLLIAGPVYLITICSAEFFLICSTDRQATIPESAEYGFSFLDDVVSARTIFQPSLILVAELRVRTQKRLKERVVVPSVDQGLILVMFSGCKAPSRRYRHSSECCPVHPKSSHAVSTWLSKTIRAFYTAPISALVKLPRFLSVTFALGDVPSLLIDEKRLRILRYFNTVLASFSLPLSKLRTENDGFRNGVASLLVQELCSVNAENVYKLTELSFLSEYGKSSSCSLGRRSES
ncbi:putative act-like protein [Golovinomyces cichoracearum]|uniref:Putative act-like protein n=1 Tax=Golovinomyces cichoracearum TaxID=62708 RepID=A0A420HXC6_9PEZI|nr:putative act-like protein [Golovinomyces cichoracearum]